jgi:hypothetical protein
LIFEFDNRVCLAVKSAANGIEWGKLFVARGCIRNTVSNNAQVCIGNLIRGGWPVRRIWGGYHSQLLGVLSAGCCVLEEK